MTGNVVLFCKKKLLKCNHNYIPNKNERFWGHLGQKTFCTRVKITVFPVPGHLAKFFSFLYNNSSRFGPLGQIAKNYFEVSNLKHRQDHCWCILVGIYHVLKFKLRELLLWRGCVIWAKWALYCYFRAFRFKTGPLSQKCTWQVCVLCWFFGRSLIYVFKKVWHYALYTFVKSVQIDELH